MKDVIARLVEGAHLDAAQVESAMDAIFRGQVSPVQLAAFLVALRIKGETAAEVAAAARVMRKHAVPVTIHVAGPVVDTCGTGGDGSDSFNISTIAALVVSAAGVTVAKHGNRAATSRAGSADLLEALGVDLSEPPDRIGRCIDALGIGFMFARAHHPAMKHVAPVRAELPMRTIFNLLGPLTNPAGATHQLVGVGDPTRMRLMAEVLALLGTSAAWVVHGDGGLDEMSLSGSTRILEVARGELHERELSPEDFGLARAPREALRGGDVGDNAAIARAILAGERGPRRDAVVLNAAAALLVAGVESDPRAAADRAADALDRGAAARKLEAWIAFER